MSGQIKTSAIATPETVAKDNCRKSKGSTLATPGISAKTRKEIRKIIRTDMFHSELLHICERPFQKIITFL